jgi:hypothetical protein
LPVSTRTNVVERIGHYARPSSMRPSSVLGLMLLLLAGCADERAVGSRRVAASDAGLTTAGAPLSPGVDESSESCLAREAAPAGAVAPSSSASSASDERPIPDVLAMQSKLQQAVGEFSTVAEGTAWYAGVVIDPKSAVLTIYVHCQLPTDVRAHLAALAGRGFDVVLTPAKYSKRTLEAGQLALLRSQRWANRSRGRITVVERAEDGHGLDVGFEDPSTVSASELAELERDAGVDVKLKQSSGFAPARVRMRVALGSR